MTDYYGPIMREAYPDDYPKRERDLEHFQNLAERYRSLDSMLADMALEPPNDSIGEVLAVEAEEGYVTLSTIHSAKGLEWRVVFVIWAAEGRFPGPMSVGVEEIEEERRLMYVAGTRARDSSRVDDPATVRAACTSVIAHRFSVGLDLAATAAKKPAGSLRR